ncbi:MAG: phage terminase large subunit [Clostridiaceae bacterium]|jgi:phage terminase large subunit|nr:phage terminase large subunit [Clostridiaceae bacterium]
MMKIHLTDLIDRQFYEVHKAAKSGNAEIFLRGGRGSCKSSFAAFEIILRLIGDGTAGGVILRQFQNTVENSVFAQLRWATDKAGISGRFKFLKSPYKAVYLPTGQTLFFCGADKPESLRSLVPPAGTRNKILWFEEAVQFKGAAAVRDIKQSVIRGTDQALVLYSYNPPRRTAHWINAFETSKASSVRHTSCYLNVGKPEWLGRSFLTEADSLKTINPRAYAHEYLGEPVDNDDLVFNNFERKTHVIDALNFGEVVLRTVISVDPAVERDCTAAVPIHITNLGRAVVGKVFYYEPTAPGCSPLAPSAQVSLIKKWLDGLSGKWEFDTERSVMVFDQSGLGAAVRREWEYQTGIPAIELLKERVIDSILGLKDLFDAGALYILDDDENRCPLTGRIRDVNPLIYELEHLVWASENDANNKDGIIPEGQKQDATDALRYGAKYFRDPQLLRQFSEATRLKR